MGFFIYICIMRKLRKLTKMSHYNDGSRDLLESILNYDVWLAMNVLLKHNDMSDCLLIGGLALSYHTKPYATSDIDIIVKTKRKFKYFPNNIRNNIKIDIHTCEEFNISEKEFDMLYKSGIKSNHITIASPSALMTFFLKNFNYVNKYRAEMLTYNCIFDTNLIGKISGNDKLNIFNLYIKQKNKDYNMKYLRKFKEYFNTSIYEGTSGYPEVDNAFNDWVSSTNDIKQVLIGGIAFIQYKKDNDFRQTTDVDFLFLSKNDIPEKVDGFKRLSDGMFQHNKTHVIVDTVDFKKIQISEKLAKVIFDTAYDKDNYMIASPSAIIALKLESFRDKDKFDMLILYKNYDIDLTDFKPHMSKKALSNLEIFLTEYNLA